MVTVLILSALIALIGLAILTVFKWAKQALDDQPKRFREEKTDQTGKRYYYPKKLK